MSKASIVGKQNSGHKICIVKTLVVTNLHISGIRRES